MIIARRSFATLFVLLCSFGIASSQETTPATAQSVAPIVTATASVERVRYISAGEVHQTRLQVFSGTGEQVYDSGLRLGNLIDWQLRDQQGAPVRDGSYLYLITVKEFSERLTQKYGTAIVDRNRVYLEQPGRTELPQLQSAALEAGKLTETLSLVDRVGADGGSHATSTTTAEGEAVIDSAPLENKKKTAAASVTPDGGETIAGTGTLNRVSKWVDSAGTLGDSAITEIGGKVGIGITNPSYKLVVGPDIGAGLVAADLTISRGVGQSVSAFVGPSGARGMEFGWDEAGSRAFLNAPANTPITFLQGGPERMRISAAGNVGIGNTSPTFKFDVLGNIRAANSSSNDIQVETSGGQNSWARLSMKTPNQRWVLGTSQAFNGDQLYLYDDTFGQIRMSVQPNSGAIVFPSGNIGIGTTPTIGRLHVLGDVGLNAVYGESPNRGVWGKSTGSSYGVYGESVGGIGIQGVSSVSIGVVGTTAAGGSNTPGVYGVASGSNGVGVLGEANNGNAWGVYGKSMSTSSTSIGVYGGSTNGMGLRGDSTGALGYGAFVQNLSGGMALGVNGDAAQSHNNGGLVKAMIYIKQDGTIARCYNSQRIGNAAFTGTPLASTAPCGFSVTHDSIGSYIINFGFQVSDRFYSLTVSDNDGIYDGNFVTGLIRSNETEPGIGANSLRVLTFQTAIRSFQDVSFIIIVY